MVHKFRTPVGFFADTKVIRTKRDAKIETAEDLAAAERSR